jgi:hypothetical protein
MTRFVNKRKEEIKRWSKEQIAIIKKMAIKSRIKNRIKEILAE